MRIFQEKKKTGRGYKTILLRNFLIFWEHLLKAVCVLDHPVFLHLLLLGPIGPLTKKHTDDLGDSDRTDDEGIFSPNANLICMTRETKLTLPPFNFYLLWFSYISCPFFEKWWTFSFCSLLVKLSFWAGCVLSFSAWCLKFTCLPPFFDINTCKHRFSARICSFL